MICVGAYKKNENNNNLIIGCFEEIGEALSITD